MLNGVYVVIQQLWQSAAFLRAAASETLRSDPNPISRALPRSEYRRIHDLAPCPVTCRYSPAPSGCIPGSVAFCTFVAVSWFTTWPKAFFTQIYPQG